MSRARVGAMGWSARVARAARAGGLASVLAAAVACGGYEDAGDFAVDAPIRQVKLALEVEGIDGVDTRRGHYRVRVVGEREHAGEVDSGRCRAVVRGCFELGQDGTVALEHACAGRWNVSAEVYDESTSPCDLDGDSPASVALCNAPLPPVFSRGDEHVPLRCARNPAQVTFDVQIR